MSLRILILMGGFMSLSGCVAGVVAGAGAIGVSALQDRTLGQSLDDATTAGEVKAKLIRNGPMKFAEVDVEIADRLLLLSGRVISQEDRLEAERIAWTVNLVENVVNELQIRDKGGVKQNLNDEWISTRVRSRLFTDGGVKSVNVNIETYDGTVYLMGIARNEAELQRIVEHASLVSGVKEVVTYIRVKDTETATPLQAQQSPARYAQPPAPNANLAPQAYQAPATDTAPFNPYGEAVAH